MILYYKKDNSFYLRHLYRFCRGRIVFIREVYRLWRWHFSRRRNPEQEFMDSGQEWEQQAEEKYWLPEEQKEESNYQLRPHLMWPFYNYHCRTAHFWVVRIKKQMLYKSKPYSRRMFLSQLDEEKLTVESFLNGFAAVSAGYAFSSILNRKRIMLYSESLKKNKDFQIVYRTGRSYANRFLVMYIRKNDLNRNRLGISVSKKVGNSVVRHHLTRLIRESYRLQEEYFLCGYDIVAVVRVNAKNSSFADMKSALIHLGKLHKIYISEKEDCWKRKWFGWRSSWSDWSDSIKSICLGWRQAPAVNIHPLVHSTGSRQSRSMVH